jgi:hypothetical protein
LERDKLKTENINNTVSDHTLPEGKILTNKLDVKKKGSRSKVSQIMAALAVPLNN